MRLLILGGTAFLSARIAVEALGRGIDVTCLARGSTQQPPDGARWIPADRDSGLAAYEKTSGDWDGVVEVSRQPIQVRQALEALSGRAAHWTFVSTCSVYADQTRPGEDESAALLDPLAGDALAEAATYGEGKVSCENAVLQAIGDRAHISRAGLIVGPRDPSDRFGYWPARFARDGGDVLVPGSLVALTQVISVVDLARWIVDAIVVETTGILNAVGDPVPLGELLNETQRIAGHPGEQIVVDHYWLVEQGVNYWAGPDSLPLWLPVDNAGFGCRSNAAAREAGMQLSPISDVIEQTIADERDRGFGRERRAGITAERERELLSSWAARFK